MIYNFNYTREFDVSDHLVVIDQIAAEDLCFGIFPPSVIAGHGKAYDLDGLSDNIAQ